MPAEKHRPPKVSSLGRSLVLLVLVCWLPAVIVSGFLAAEAWRLLREKTAEKTVTLAREIAGSLDQELAGIESGLAVLATSPELARGDLGAFHTVASAAVLSQIVYNYIVTEPGGRMVLNTLVPWGEALPTGGTPAVLEKVFSTGRPVLTGYFIGPVTRKPALAMGVPVTIGGKVRYSLNIGLTPPKVAEILSRSELPDQWVASVLDAQGTIIARTRDGTRFEGSPAVPAVRRLLNLQSEGSLEATTVDGTPVVTSFSRSRRWDWAVAVGAPRVVLEAELARLMGWAAAGALLAVVLGLGVASRLGRRVTGSIRGLNDAALALGEGQPVRLPKVQWAEAEAVGRALVQASELMAREHHRATHDPLTGLANRALFDELLRHEFGSAERLRGPLALVALDLDGFKGVNDTFGHAAGDLVLREAADRIQSQLRSSDTAARLGGDEFSVLLSGCPAEAARAVAQRLVDRLSEPYPGEVGHAVTSSAGVVTSVGGSPALNDLVHRADEALYRAKAAGKGCVAGEP